MDKFEYVGFDFTLKINPIVRSYWRTDDAKIAGIIKGTDSINVEIVGVAPGKITITYFTLTYEIMVIE